MIADMYLLPHWMEKCVINFFLVQITEKNVSLTFRWNPFYWDRNKLFITLSCTANKIKSILISSNVKMWATRDE